MKCKECGVSLKNNKSLITHLRYHHSNISSKNYYDKYLKNTSSEGICLTCGKPTKYVNLSKGYREFCSCKCMSNNNLIKYKKKETCLKNYGVEYPSQNVDVLNKKKETCLKNYGVEYPSQNVDVLNKMKSTCMKKYEVENPSQNENVKQKKRDTCKKNYGVEYSFQSKEILGKIKNTCKKKYGVIYPSQNELIKKKRKDTFIEKYGGHPSRNEEVKQKIKNTCIKNYGVSYPGQSKEVKDKIKNTFIKNYLSKVQNVLKSLNIEIISDYSNYRNDIYIKCLLCFKEFNTTLYNIKQGYGKCPNCFPRYKSIAEQEILNFINNLGIKTINNSRKIIPPYEIDIYIPDKKIGIEYNGLYWHSDNYRYSENNGRDKNYHLNKLNKCLENDVNLIQIFEDEWIINKDIVKSRLRQILGINERSPYSSERIHARKCIIKEIDSKVKNAFLEKYHLQGKDASKIKLGAFFNEELVAVMTFSKGNIAKGSFSKKGVWELNRFCSYSDYPIPGIASKLLANFKRNYSWKEIFSYADRRWSVGNLYFKLGFSLKHITKPNYWYVKGINRIHRFNLRKRFDEPKDIPEWMLRLKEGYSRVWDCGHLKFVLINK